MSSALIRAFALRPLLVGKSQFSKFFSINVSTPSSSPTPSPGVTVSPAVTSVKGSSNPSVRAPPSGAAAATTSSSSASSSSSSSSSQVDNVVHVNCTMNNIVVSVSTLDGEVISRFSGGMIGLKHRARASASAATDIARSAAQKAVEKGFKVTEVRLKGPSRSRGQILRGIQGAGMKISEIRDMTPMPTNGCRPPAARRL